MPNPSSARAVAHANIALAKYWGKASSQPNLPAVPSVSVTLEALRTSTTVAFDAALDADELHLDGVSQQGRPLVRVSGLLDLVRECSGASAFARVESTNNFPTASGLASSASGFAALAIAAQRAAGLAPDLARASDMARQASASAARSVFGGFVKLPVAEPGQQVLAAVPIASPDHWDVRIVVAVTSRGEKRVGSTEGMLHTQATSPYFSAWRELCSVLAPRIERAILERDLPTLGTATEQSALAMHACALAADPGIVYFEPTTIACVHAVRQLRDSGVPAFITMDAGPHVKVLTVPEHEGEVVALLEKVPGVLQVIASRLGGPAQLQPIEQHA